MTWTPRAAAALLTAALLACGSPRLDDAPAGSTEADAPVIPEDRPRPAPNPPGTDTVAEIPVPECEVEERRSDVANEVAIETGWVRGSVEGDVTVWRGIPFAAPPVGDNRFRAPQPAACWDGVLDTQQLGPRCPQLRFIGNEDCLSLNVWRPISDAEAPRPVMVWVYGGANIFGSSGGQYPLSYDAARLAADGDVVVVSFNYRVGALGWLAHEGLDHESPHGVSGNYGLQDQLAALHWVQRNITRFGGDPNDVTLFGESAGAVNTCMLLTSPAAEGLFHRAAMQSGECLAPSMQFRKDASARVARDLGCNGSDGEVVACLRGLGAGVLSGALPIEPDVVETWNLPWGPGVDGALLPAPPLDAIARGEHHDVPIVIGSNADETEVFIPPILGCSAYRDFLEGALPNDAERILEEYPCEAYSSARQALVSASTDLLFTCPARRTARLLAAVQSAPVWRYHYRYVSADPLLSFLGAFHASEVPMIFGSYGRVAYTPPPHEDAFSAAIRGAWTSFARTDDPGIADWAPYVPGSDPVLAFDGDESGPVIDPVTGFDTDICDFWDPLLP